jgi:hypothetical protein
MESIPESMRSYGEVSEFKKMALMIIAHQSTTDEIIQLRKAFDQFDKENDGTISFEEFYDQVKLRAKIIKKREEAKAMAEAKALLKRVGEIAALQPAVAEVTSHSLGGSKNYDDETKDAGKDGMNEGGNQQVGEEGGQGVPFTDPSIKNVDKRDENDVKSGPSSTKTAEDKELELHEVVSYCSRRLARRFLVEVYKRSPPESVAMLDKEIEKLARVIADRIQVEFAWFGSSIAKPSQQDFADLMRQTISLTTGSFDISTNQFDPSRITTHRPSTPPVGAPTIIVDTTGTLMQPMQNGSLIQVPIRNPFQQEQQSYSRGRNDSRQQPVYQQQPYPPQSSRYSSLERPPPSSNGGITYQPIPQQQYGRNSQRAPNNMSQVPLGTQLGGLEAASRRYNNPDSTL